MPVPGKSPEHQLTFGKYLRAVADEQIEPDFSKMTPAEKARWNVEPWKRIVG